MNKDVTLFSKNNAEPDESNIQGNEDYSKRNTSERLELKFWNEMKKVHPRNERMLIYDQKIKNGLIYRGDGQDKEFKTNCMNEKNPDAIIYPDKNNLNTILKNSLKNDPLKKNPKKKKLARKWKILIGSVALAIIATVIVLCIIFLREKEEKFKNETYVTGLTYKENQVMRFQNKKTTTLNFDLVGFNDPTSPNELIEYSDYLIGISKRSNEREGEVDKEIFEGYIFQENYILDNKTNKMLLQNSSLFQEVWQKYYFRNLQEMDEQKYVNFALDQIEPYGCIDDGTLPIMKFTFYRNGVIKKIYKPKNLATILYNNMMELLEKVIPKIAEEQFNKSYSNISEALKSEYDKLNNNDDDDSIIRNVRLLDKKEKEKEKEKKINMKKPKKVKIIKLNKRQLESLNDQRKADDDSISYEDLEEIISQQYNEENEFNINLFNNNPTEGSNSDNNNTVLNYYSHTKVRNGLAEFKGSQQNTTINSIIDEKEKSIKEVHYTYKGSLFNDSQFEEDELTEEKQGFCSNDNFLDCSFNPTNNKENTIHSQIKGMDYEIKDDVISTANFIDKSRLAISRLEETFKLYENDLEEVEGNQKTNSNKRFLKHLTNYLLANKFDFSDVEIQIGEDDEKRRTEESSTYYGMKNMESVKNLFNLNLIGIQSKLQIKNTLYIKEGKSVILLILQFAFIKISITVKTVNTNMHYAIRNYNEMGFTQIYLINESNEKLKNRNKYYGDIILRLENDFHELITNRYDFSNLFKECFDQMYDEIKNFTVAVFTDFIKVLNRSYNNYTKLFNEVNRGNQQSFNEIIDITKNQYLEYINSNWQSIDAFNTETINFLSDVEEKVSNIGNLELDVLYEFIDAINKTKKIFIDFNTNLYLVLDTAIRTFNYDFKDSADEMIGDLLNILTTITQDISKNEFLKLGMDEEVRNDVLIKLQNMSNIINITNEKLIGTIHNDYRREMNVSILNSRKNYTESKMKQYLEELERRSNNIIRAINNKIEHIQLYQIYTENLDKIEEITKGINNVFLDDIYKDTKSKLKEIKPEYLKEDSSLIEKKENLYDTLTSIDNVINNEVNDIDYYIKDYTKDFRIRRQYQIYFDLLWIKYYFNDTSMNNLREQFYQNIRDAVSQSVYENMTYNYRQGDTYLRQVLNIVSPSSYDGLNENFYYKYITYSNVLSQFLPQTYNGDAIKHYKINFLRVKNEILTFVENKIKEIQYHYFNISLYENNFYFISQIHDEIEYLISNIKNYFNEDYFDNIVSSFIVDYTKSELESINEGYKTTLSSLYSSCIYYSRTWYPFGGDYCTGEYYSCNCGHIDGCHDTCFRCTSGHSVSATNNHGSLINNLDNLKKFVNISTSDLIAEFENKIDVYLSSYVEEIQSLFDKLKGYADDKMGNITELRPLINQYNSILDDMTEKANSDINLQEENIESFLDNLNSRAIDIKDEYFENTYLTYYHLYLDYPDEVLYKIIYLSYWIGTVSNKIKQQINNMVRLRITRTIEENHVFIKKTQDFFREIIKIKLENKKIFEEYKTNRADVLQQRLIEYTYVNNYNQDYLTESFYSSKINAILQDYRATIAAIEEEINEDWNCEEIFSPDNPTLETNQIILTSLLGNSRFICNKFLEGNIISYNEYDFNVVKLREGIDYIKYLYKNLENLFTTFNFDYLMDLNEIKKQSIMIDDKDIFNLYYNSKTKLEVLNQDSNDTLEDVYSYYLEDIEEAIINEHDFSPNYEKFAEMLKFTEENFKSEVHSQINNITSNIFGIFEEYNNSLQAQINIAKSYDKYNYNNIRFQEFFDLKLLEIKNKFEQIIIPKIRKIAINDDFIFNNALRKKMYALYFEKSSEFKKIVEELNKLYDIKPFNLTFNMEDATKFIIKRLLDNTVFKYIYDYMEAYEFNKHIYRNTILTLVQGKYDIITNKFNIINANFLDEMHINKDPYIINNEYVSEYRENYTRCLNYPLEELNEFLRKDEENYHKLTIYNNRKSMCDIKPVAGTGGLDSNFVINNIDINNLNITDLNIIEIINRITQNTEPSYSPDDDLNSLDVFLDSFCVETYANEFIFINQTEILLECYNNFYYAKNITYLEDFDVQIKSDLSELVSKSINEIDSFYLGGEFIENYLFSNDYIKLNPWENYSTGEINYHVYNFYYMSDYIYKKMKSQYNEFLSGKIIQSFETSSRYFAQNTLLPKMQDNLEIFVFGKIKINLEFIKEKIISETDYYITILNKMNKISAKSKDDLISLYANYIYDTVSSTIRSQIEEYIKKNITFFYRENKYIFKEMFINHYLNNATEKFSADNIFHLYSSLKELILNNSFNETLEAISIDIWDQSILNDLNQLIEDKLTILLGGLNNVLSTQKGNILSNLPTTEENIDIASLYQIIITQINLANNQITLFPFSISDEPKVRYKNFIESYFEIPLNKIILHYGETQNKISVKVEETTREENMPDSFLEIQEKYNITKQMDEMFEIIKATYINLINYTNDFTNDIDDYDEILPLYTFIDTSSAELRSLNDYLRGNKRNLGEKENKVFIKKDKKLISKIKKLAEKNINNNNKNKKIDDSYSKKEFIHTKPSSNSKKTRNLNTHSDNGSATNSLFKRENKKFFETIKNFNEYYLSEMYENFKSDWEKEMDKIDKYIINIERTKNFVVLKFEPIVSEVRLNQLKEIVNRRYVLIYGYLQEFKSLTTEKNDIYIALLDSSTQLLLKAFDEVDNKIIYNFIMLKEFIIAQIEEISGTNNHEEIDGNKRHKDVFNNGYLYKPITINNMKGTNDNQNGINFNKAEIVNEFYKLLKYSKYNVFEPTNAKFEALNNLLQQSSNRVSPTPDVSSIINNVINNIENEYEGLEINVDLMKGESSVNYVVDLSQNNILNNDYFKIPIIHPFYIVFEPLVKIGYKITIGSKTELYKEINDIDNFKQKVQAQLSSVVENNEDQIANEDDAQIVVKIFTEGEAYLDASAGIVLGDTNTFAFSYISGVQGLIGKGIVSFDMTINVNNLNVNINKYYGIYPYDITQFIKKEIISNLSIVNFLSNILSFEEHRQQGLPHSIPFSTNLKVAARLLFDEFQINNRNQLY